MAHNLVSIIIPVFNRASFLEATLNSVKAQNYQNWECIVVDDHSTDDSWKILNTYQHEDSRFKVFKRPDARPKGANACRNFGFEQASGMYVNWFDSDDLMKPTFLQSKIDKHAGGNFDLVLSKTIISTLGSNEYVNEHRTKLSSNLLEDFLTRKITWYLPDPMFKKSFLIGHILFDENLLGGRIVIFSEK
ncbi:glycosyltransferase family 2 protein [Leeuwenhoekiella sp. MAR_2009_132]|uniref:glycosyltransferase family 2 protein n=1 Tax=Leeuwenhoekiella sp. MAR_2009_132 TaxID=1392489 RepID=UPI00048AD134|nr:glycosyltransferase family 2 protein [Leeuwenhoekiella sp. MAR_2009_132]